MSEWMNYMANCDGRPTSVKIDLAFEKSQPRDSLPRFFAAHLRGFESDSRGFPSKKAFFRQLYPFEDAFAKVVENNGGVLVVTTVDAITASYAAYLGAPVEISDEVKRLARESGLRLAISDNPRSDWSEYVGMLPSKEQRTWCRDSQLIQELKRRGDDPKRPRDVDFVIDFNDSASAEMAAPALAAVGRAIVDRAVPSVRVTFNMALSVDEIAALRERLATIASDYGGTLDGWGCIPKFLTIRALINRFTDGAPSTEQTG